MSQRIFRGECGFEGCTKEIEASGKCAAHRKRKVRARPESGEVRVRSKTAYEGITNAALAYADAAAEGSDLDFERAQWRWRRALARFRARVASNQERPETPLSEAEKKLDPVRLAWTRESCFKVDGRKRKR